MNLRQSVQSWLEPVLRRTPLSQVAGPTLVELDLSRGIQESSPASPLAAVRHLRTPMLRGLIRGLREAADDDAVVGLIATIGPSVITLAQSGELRDAIRRFRESGKPAIAWSAAFGEVAADNTGYHLATAFDEIWLQPSGAVGLVGFAAEPVFARDALDKLGIAPHFSQRHEYKSAAETFMRKGISEPSREMLGRLVDSSTDLVIADVAASRALPESEVRAILAAGPRPAAVAAEHGLVDHVGYRDQAYAALRERVGHAEPGLRFAERFKAGRLDGLIGPITALTNDRPVIGLIQATGAIHRGHPGGSPASGPTIGSDALDAALRAAGRNRAVKAVVLRIDSPGGSYVASDAIRRAVMVLRDSGTPVVASMASVAASGGYYIAMPCTTIVANPGTVTGSIGVLAGKSVLRDGLSRIGIARETIAAAPYAAMMSSNQPFSEEEAALLERWLDEVYDDFTGKAAADRGLALDELRGVAKGRVWTGADAAERGLVDTLGGLDRAVDEACRLAAVRRAEARVQVIPKPNPLQSFLPRDNSDAVEAGAPPTLEGPAGWRRLLPELRVALGLEHAGVLTLPPVRLPGLLPSDV
ncbi:MAG: signal peptide peptidase SppA [Nocardioides sp.]